MILQKDVHNVTQTKKVKVNILEYKLHTTYLDLSIRAN